MSNRIHLLNGNSAERLLSLTKRLLETKKDIQCIEAFKEVFEETSAVAAFHNLGLMMGLATESHNTVVAEFPALKESADTWYSAYEALVLQLRPTHAMSVIHAAFQPHHLQLLQVTAQLLASKSPVDLSREVLQATILEVAELLVEIRISDIDENVKGYLITTLTNLLTHLQKYRITGPAPVLATTEQLTGHLFYDVEYRKVLADTDFGQRLSAVIQNLANAVTVLTPIAPLLAGAAKKLLG